MQIMKKAKEEEDFYKSAIKDYWYDLKKVEKLFKKIERGKLNGISSNQKRTAYN